MQTVSAFCELNKIEDIDGFIKKCFTDGFNIEKYGLLGKTLNEGEKQVIEEVIVEKRVEVPVEVIKEVEKIIEIPIEVIKEVPVEKVVTKIEYISDKTTENKLGEKVAELMNEMSKKDEELNELRQNLDIYRHKLDEKNEEKEMKMLQETLQKLRKDLSTKNKKIENLEKINQELELSKNPLKGIFMRGSNLNDTL